MALFAIRYDFGLFLSPNALINISRQKQKPLTKTKITKKKTYWFPESPYRRMLNGSAFATRDSELALHPPTTTSQFLSLSLLFFPFFLLNCSVYKKIYTSADFYVILDDIFIFNLQMTSFEITFPHLDGRDLGDIGKICIFRLKVPSDTLHFKVERAVRYFAPDAKETLRTSTIQ